MVDVRFVNDTTPIEVTSETQETQINVTSETQVKNIGVKSSRGTDKHDELSNRDLPDQHPISAITGLQEALDTIPDDYVSEAELEVALNDKQDVISDLDEIRAGASAGATAVQPADLAAVATSGSYNDLSNKPTIPSAQVNSDWNANSGVAQILNKPTLGTMAAESASDYTKTSGLATVATSGSYNDLLNKPTIPTVNNATISFTQGGVSKGSITLNQATDQTIALDAGGGGGGSYTAGDGIDITNDVISVDAEATAEVDVQSIVEVDTESLQETTAEDLLKLITGYNANATQTLKNINGSIQWVTD